MRKIQLFLMSFVLVLIPVFVTAQENSDSSKKSDNELKVLRQKLDKQAKQINQLQKMLKQQIMVIKNQQQTLATIQQKIR